VAQWALEQVRPSLGAGDLSGLIEDLQRGQLRAIRGKVEALGPSDRARLGRELTGWLEETLDAGELPGPFVLTVLQYTAPADAAPALCRALSLAMCPDGRFIWSRLIRAVGAVTPLEAVMPLADAVCHPDVPPDHRQMAAVCLEKILSARGDAARRAVSSHRDRIARALAQLEQALCATPRVEPERPWHHYAGTPGWRAACKRALAAMRRLLSATDEAAGDSRSVS
jgi:hypothetical protein